MKLHFPKAPRWSRGLHTTAPMRRTILPVETGSGSSCTSDRLASFRANAFKAGKPLIFRKDSGSPASVLPALDTWFSKNPESEGNSHQLSPKLQEFMQWPFPYELVVGSDEALQALHAFRESLTTSPDLTTQILAGILQSTLAEAGAQRFFQLYAPLELLRKALEFNRNQQINGDPVLELYIAQSSLSDLPPELQPDLPVPELVLKVGKGDVYSSSIWMGTEPTYTPLHRDPNPNLFCQLCSQKSVRLLPPDLGQQMYFQVQVKIRQEGNSRIRSTEMMEGEERKVLHDAVWQPEELPKEMCEADLRPGDALFVPEGWWHSVKSIHSSGALNASVNWWFR